MDDHYRTLMRLIRDQWSSVGCLICWWRGTTVPQDDNDDWRGLVLGYVVFPSGERR